MQEKHPFLHLRESYPTFSYNQYEIIAHDEKYILKFHFSIEALSTFTTELTIPKKPFFKPLSTETWHTLAFHIGMIEAISYWKATCSPTFKVKPFALTKKQIEWWKKLYFFGLGEFFYQNKIDLQMENFMEIEASTGGQLQKLPSLSLAEGVIIPIGGGKDSAVTLETLLAGKKEVYPMAINPRKAIEDTITNAGLNTDSAIFLQRNIDPNLLELNAKGFLNGHTPFSAMVAFVSLLVSALSGIKDIALSNESSANEVTIPNTTVNHQYSKSFDFENDFRDYCIQNISPEFNYFSFLRPVNELQIAHLFSQQPQHHLSFRSCNQGSKTNSWCGACPKCLFTAIILSPFLQEEAQQNIFHKNLFMERQLESTLLDLMGESEGKPFECVGTTEEINAAISAAKALWKKPLPYLLSHTNNTPDTNKSTNLLKSFSTQHFLTAEYVDLLKKALHIS